MSEEIRASVAPISFTLTVAHKPLITIRPDGAVEAESLEAASEAGKVFVESIRGNLATQSETAALRAEVERLREALKAAASALAWAERRMICKAYAEVIANDERNARAAAFTEPQPVHNPQLLHQDQPDTPTR